MRYLLLLFSLFLVTQTYAQLTTKSSARKSKAFGSLYSEDFTVKVKANAFSVEFERYDPYLDDDLKEKIKNFF